MSELVKSCMLEESKIVLQVEIPINPDASNPLEHLGNEGRIEEAILAAGRAATQCLFQNIADRHNDCEKYSNEAGYSMRQKYQTTEDFLTPYGHISVTAPYFSNDYKKLSDRPFERETLMEKHHISPMAQYVLLRMLANKGPQACARDFEEERGIHVSHHLIDIFLEDMGLKYADLRREFLDEVVRNDWRPSWRPCLLTESTSQEKEVADTELLASLETEVGKPVIPVVQVDAMRLGVREYVDRILNGKPDSRKYKVVFHELHNAFMGFQVLDGPRKADDPLQFREVRYMSEYFVPDALPQDASDYLKRCGVKPGGDVLCMGDGAKLIWPRYEKSFQDFNIIPILDVRHCEINLFTFIGHCFPDEQQRQNTWVEKQMEHLYEGRYESFFNSLNYAVRLAPSKKALKKMKSKRKYFRRNSEGIRYKDILESGYPISSCFVESAHNHVIGMRVRKNGRTYREDRLQMIADFRAEYKSHRLPYVFERILEIEAENAA